MAQRKSRINRRGFLKGTAAAVAGVTIVPRHVLGGPGNVPPSAPFQATVYSGQSRVLTWQRPSRPKPRTLASLRDRG